MEENKKDVLPLEGEPLTTPQISEPVVNALAAALNKIETYVPTQYINDGPPDIDAEHLNHAEQAIMRVTNLANGAADAISALQSQVTQLNNNFSVYKYSSSKIEMSGQLDSIIEWLKSNTTKFFVYNYVRVEPTDSDGYFGNSSFDILWNLSSASYGWIMLRSDNPKSVLFGRLVDGNAQWDIPVFKSDMKVLKKTDVQFSDGFAKISFPGLTYDSAVCINQEYKSSAGVQNLVFTAQVRPNELIIYARNANDGSSYNGIIHIMAIAIG
jgi:hypothetical protein|nr:MAG TPA: hypothetical protein [Caudoviricetes sp.]